MNEPDLFAALRGVAARRGEAWAERTWPRVHRAERSKPWPDTPRSRALAAKQVADLGGGDAVRQRLADVAHEAAVKRWEELRRGR